MCLTCAANLQDMNKPYPFFLLVLILTLFEACKSGQPDNNVMEGPHFQMKGMDWILGEWEGKEENTFFFEKWEKEDDSTYLGTGKISKGEQVLVNEKLVLDMQMGIIMYGVDIEGSGQGMVYFRMMEKTDSLWVFSNPEHEYPQNIIYRRVSADSMTAEISGVFKGSYQKEVFTFKRKSSGL